MNILISSPNGFVKVDLEESLPEHMRNEPFKYDALSELVKNVKAAQQRDDDIEDYISKWRKIMVNLYDEYDELFRQK